jgi:hypothetical protein
VTLGTYQLSLRCDAFTIEGQRRDGYIHAQAIARSLPEAIALVIAEAKQLEPRLRQADVESWPRPVINAEECYALGDCSLDEPALLDIEIGWHEPI